MAASRFQPVIDGCLSTDSATLVGSSLVTNEANVCPELVTKCNLPGRKYFFYVLNKNLKYALKCYVHDVTGLD